MRVYNWITYKSVKNAIQKGISCRPFRSLQCHFLKRKKMYFKTTFDIFVGETALPVDGAPAKPLADRLHVEADVDEGLVVKDFAAVEDEG